jgi:adenosine kinase
VLKTSCIIITATDKATVFFGCVGKDDTSKTLAKCAESAGVDVRYQYSADHPTGKCAVLITGQDRSLVTKLDAANHFTVDHLEPNWSVVEKAKTYYSSGFFLTVSAESMLKVAQHAVDNGKVFAMNLSAPFLSQFFSEPMEKVMALSAIVFGNETEAVAFAEKQGYGITNVKEIAEKMAQIPLEGKIKRTVVITQGADTVIVVHDGKTKEYPVKKLSADKIVDTNGAGDAFVGGYLAQLVQGKDQDTCVKCGVWAATEIIQRSGCTVPDKMEFK